MTKKLMIYTVNKLVTKWKINITNHPKNESQASQFIRKSNVQIEFELLSLSLIIMWIPEKKHNEEKLCLYKWLLYYTWLMANNL